MGKRRDHEIKRYLKDEVKARLALEETGVFSRTEVMRTFRNLLHGHDAEKKDEVLQLRNKGQIDRRQFLKALGFGMGGAVVASSSLGYFMGKKVFDERTHHPTGYAVMDISPGDEIGSAINSQLSDGTELHIPEGTYNWSDSIDVSVSDASVIGDGNVIFDRGTGRNIRIDARATGGVLAFKNWTAKGQAGDEGKCRFQADSGATIRVENVRQPDGTEDCSECVGLYCPDGHAGQIEFVACELQGFGNNGVYAGSPGESGSGQGIVKVIGGFFRNNNIASIRLGSDGSLAKDTIIINEETPPSRCESGTKARGIWMREDGGSDNATITAENVHITQRDKSGIGQPIGIEPYDNSGTFTGKNICIVNDTDEPAITSDGGTDISGDGLILKGSGDLSYDGDWSNVCEGSSCDECQAEEIQIGDIPIGSSGGSSGGNGAPC